MGREILADNGYSLNINSFLFAILVDHIDDDIVEIGYEDFENKRGQFWNCGKVCYYAFSKYELSYTLSNFYRPYIYSVGKEKWAVNLKEIFGDFLNSLNEEELEVYRYKAELAKIFYLYNWLELDIRIFDYPSHSVTRLLRCLWLFKPIEKNKHKRHLFDIAKKIEPNGNNSIWLKMVEELIEIEFNEKTALSDNNLIEIYIKRKNSIEEITNSRQI